MFPLEKIMNLDGVESIVLKTSAARELAEEVLRLREHFEAFKKKTDEYSIWVGDKQYKIMSSKNGMKRILEILKERDTHEEDLLTKKLQDAEDKVSHMEKVFYEGHETIKKAQNFAARSCELSIRGFLKYRKEIKSLEPQYRFTRALGYFSK